MSHWLFLLVSNRKKSRLRTIFLCVKEKLKDVTAVTFLRKTEGWTWTSAKQTFALYIAKPRICSRSGQKCVHVETTKQNSGI